MLRGYEGTVSSYCTFVRSQRMRALELSADDRRRRAPSCLPSLTFGAGPCCSLTSRFASTDGHCEGGVAIKRVQPPAKSLDSSKHRIMRQGHRYHHHHHHRHPYEYVMYSVLCPSFELIRLVAGELVWQCATSRLRRLTFDESIRQSDSQRRASRGARGDSRQAHRPVASDIRIDWSGVGSAKDGREKA